MVLFGEGSCPCFVRNNTGSDCYCPAPSCLQWNNGWCFIIIKQAEILHHFAFLSEILRPHIFQADIQGIKNVLSSAVDVMHTIGNSTRTQLPKVLNLFIQNFPFQFSWNHIAFTQTGCYQYHNK